MTGGQIEIQDLSVDYEEYMNREEIMIPRKNVQAEVNEKSRAFPTRGIPVSDQAKKEREEDVMNNGWIDLPLQGQKTNVMYYPLPEPNFDTHHRNVMEKFVQFATFVVAVEVFKFIVLDFGRIVTLILYGCAGYYIREQMNEAWEGVKLETIQHRGEIAAHNRVPESAEWLNFLVEAVWKQMNPDIFTSVSDMLEDIMQASVPSFIHSVKVADIGQGKHALRILNMRYLPTEEMPGDTVKDEQDEHPGEYVNMEISFAYQARPSGPGVASKVKNIHLLLIFYAGVADLMGIPIPIWVEVLGLVGTVRLRMQFIPDPPFVKNTTFSFMGLPRVKISVVPIVQKFLNITNLPFISGFVQTSINAAANEYVAPKSYSLDLGQMIAGDDIKRETTALGVVVVQIHHAKNLSSQDSNGLSDPYIVVALSKYGKPIYSTRIIERTCHPVFEETAYVLITPEAVRSDEFLSIQLWDSDRLTADDELGRVEFDLKDLIRNGGSMEDRVDSLVGSQDGKKMPGKLVWSVGYFSKAPYNHELATDGSDPDLPKDIKRNRDMRDNTGAVNTETAHECSYIPPDPRYPSGILSIQIHQATSLYSNNLKGSYKSGMNYQPGQDAEGPATEEDEYAPSAYCNIIINDQLMYKTRTKPFSNKPFFVICNFEAIP